MNELPKPYAQKILKSAKIMVLDCLLCHVFHVGIIFRECHDSKNSASFSWLNKKDAEYSDVVYLKFFLTSSRKAFIASLSRSAIIF
jgi:hypothetical protein